MNPSKEFGRNRLFQLDLLGEIEIDAAYTARPSLTGLLMTAEVIMNRWEKNAFKSVQRAQGTAITADHNERARPEDPYQSKRSTTNACGQTLSRLWPPWPQARRVPPTLERPSLVTPASQSPSTVQATSPTNHSDPYQVAETCVQDATDPDDEGVKHPECGVANLVRHGLQGRGGLVTTRPSDDRRETWRNRRK